MSYNPNIHHRHSIRLKDYDYSKEGMYFITICTKNRECILSKIEKNPNVGAGFHARPEIIKLFPIGKEIKKIIIYINNHYKKTKIHEFIIMPNHIHFIVELGDVYKDCKRSGRAWKPAPTENCRTIKILCNEAI